MAYSLNEVREMDDDELEAQAERFLAGINKRAPLSSDDVVDDPDPDMADWRAQRDKYWDENWERDVASYGVTTNIRSRSRSRGRWSKVASKPVLPANFDRQGDAYPPDALYDARLHDMLSMCRPHDSAGEQVFVDTFLLPYRPVVVDDACYIIQVEDDEGFSPPVMFSCHVDTVHWSCDGDDQKIWYDPKTQSYFKKDGGPLGADDTSGMWLMLSMIDAGVAGTYFFHRGEERGGIGSSYMAQAYPELLRKFEAAIAFDRRDTTDVITYQAGGRCCSDAFAQDLADKLNAVNDDFMYMPNDGGIFTDTANYTELIPECTNISVGYQDEHTGWEEQYLPHLFDLRDALIAIDWSTLVIERDPTPAPVLPRLASTRYESAFASVDGKPDAEFTLDYRLDRMTRAEMIEMVLNQPEEFVDLVRDEFGFTR
jgi:hypothetical protein